MISTGALRRIFAFLAAMLLMQALMDSRKALSMGSTQFGTYSQAHIDQQQSKKWKELCRGAGRYQAMREAYDAGKPDPCNPKAKEWTR